MPFVTMIKSSKPVTLGKLFTLDKNGDVTKNAIANVSEGQATALGSMSSKELLKSSCGKLPKPNRLACPISTWATG